MATSTLRTRQSPGAVAGSALGPAGWALLAIVGGAAALRFSTLGVQSFWHDEAVAVGPLLVWYSQEARAYALLVLTSALTIWLFAAALQEPERRTWLAWWAAAASLALLSHYFAAFLVVPEAAWLLWSARGRELR